MASTRGRSGLNLPPYWGSNGGCSSSVVLCSCDTREDDMPYTIVRREGRYCVAKEGDGDIMGCHDTREEAVDQIAAIEANEDREKMVSEILDAMCDGDEDEKSLYRDIITLITYVHEMEQED